MRRTLLLLVVILTGARRADEGFTLRARLSATDQEADEGYFALDQQTMLVVKPDSALHTYLRTQMGKRVRLTLATDLEDP